MSLITKEQIEGDQITINLKNRLYAIRNEALDYLVTNAPDEKVDGLLKEAESQISQWTETFSDYLVTDDDYYTMVTHRIIDPVYLTLGFLNGDNDALEEERDRAISERDKLIEQLGQLKSNVEHYYGCFGGCRAWEGEQ
ncbi:hypothetical protein [Endozoicomonas ascidiicola]|uniref:hypothetical protein n=1 Tax=Endozoicomonas ascidiicola TaxID=1698521 RepID=UPI000832E2AD|nr:hypothetical protein [Endozoicomonas ascidiicola]